jgi:hypothetical protein
VPWKNWASKTNWPSWSKRTPPKVVATVAAAVADRTTIARVVDVAVAAVEVVEVVAAAAVEAVVADEAATN